MVQGPADDLLYAAHIFHASRFLRARLALFQHRKPGPPAGLQALYALRAGNWARILT